MAARVPLGNGQAVQRFRNFGVGGGEDRVWGGNTETFETR